MFMSEENEKILLEYFRRAARGEGLSADEFFDRLLYKKYLEEGNFSAALNIGKDILANLRVKDEQTYDQIHKGTPYYWLGAAAYMVNDIQTAVFFILASVFEDLRAGVDPLVSQTPSLLFMLIDGVPREQAARDLVQIIQARVEIVIDDYNRMSGKPANAIPLTIEVLRSAFLTKALMPVNESWRSIASAFLSFFAEWDYRNSLLDVVPNIGTAEPFFTHLFKGCVLFESLLKANPNIPIPQRAKTLRTVLGFLHRQLNIPKNVNITAEFQDVLDDLKTADNSIKTAIMITGKVRNSVAHNFGWHIRLNKLQYFQLYQMIACSCLHVIACLYI